MDIQGEAWRLAYRGLAFTGKALAEFLAGRGVKHVLNAIATPRANGQVERQNRTLLNAIEASAISEVDWDEGLNEIVWGLNHTVNQSSGFSPTQLMFAHDDGVKYESVWRCANGECTPGERRDL